MKRTATLQVATSASVATLALVLLFGPLAGVATASEEHPSPSISPTQSSQSSPQPESEEDELWEQAHHQQENFEHRYGPDRDIAAPPLLVKKAKSGSAGYVTQPIKISHPGASINPVSQTTPPEMLPHTFNATRNQPVIQSIKAGGFASPAEQFAEKAYLGMGMLAMVAAVLGGVVAVRYRNRGNAMDDFDLFDQTPANK